MTPERQEEAPKNNRSQGKEMATLLATKLSEVQETNQTFPINGAAHFLNDLLPEEEFRSPTLRNWVHFSLAHLVEPLMALEEEELNSKTFATLFPQPKNLILSPRACLYFKNSRVVYHLTIKDLSRIVALAQAVYKQEEFFLGALDEAREGVREFRESCLSGEALATTALGIDLSLMSDDSKQSLLKKIYQMIGNGTLPLANYPVALAWAFGIPQSFFNQELKAEWQPILKQNEALENFLTKGFRKLELPSTRLWGTYPFSELISEAFPEIKENERDKVWQHLRRRNSGVSQWVTDLWGQPTFFGPKENEIITAIRRFLREKEK